MENNRLHLSLTLIQTPVQRTHKVESDSQREKQNKTKQPFNRKKSCSRSRLMNGSRLNDWLGCRRAGQTEDANKHKEIKPGILVMRQRKESLQSRLHSDHAGEDGKSLSLSAL